MKLTSMMIGEDLGGGGNERSAPVEWCRGGSVAQGSKAGVGGTPCPGTQGANYRQWDGGVGAEARRVPPRGTEGAALKLRSECGSQCRGREDPDGEDND